MKNFWVAVKVKGWKEVGYRRVHAASLADAIAAVKRFGTANVYQGFAAEEGIYMPNRSLVVR